MKQTTLLLGGARSGKSRRALLLAGNYQCRIMIATAEAGDEEMEARVKITYTVPKQIPLFEEQDDGNLIQFAKED